MSVNLSTRDSINPTTNLLWQWTNISWGDFSTTGSNLSGDKLVQYTLTEAKSNGIQVTPSDTVRIYYSINNESGASAWCGVYDCSDDSLIDSFNMGDTVPPVDLSHYEDINVGTATDIYLKVFSPADDEFCNFTTYGFVVNQL